MYGGRLCNCVVTALRIGRDGPWKLVVISGLFSKRKDGRDLIEYFEWKGAVTSPGIPDCFYFKAILHFSNAGLSLLLLGRNVNYNGSIR